MSNKKYPVVQSATSFKKALNRVREAQKAFATYTQEQVDKIFLAAATAANQARVELAKMAVEETGMGVAEDKVIKNHFASEYIYNTYRDTKTCGVIEEDTVFGTMKIAERNHHQPASPRQKEHDRGFKDRFGGCRGGRRSRGYNRVDRRSLA